MEYKLHDAALGSTIHERDLGVWTSPSLPLSKHVADLCAKTTKMLGYARRSSLHIKSISVHRTLYLSLVRSKLCYASQVRTPQSVEPMEHMERIQRRTTKFIFDLLFIDFICDVSYSVRLE